MACAESLVLRVAVTWVQSCANFGVDGKGLRKMGKWSCLKNWTAVHGGIESCNFEVFVDVYRWEWARGFDSWTTLCEPNIGDMRRMLPLFPNADDESPLRLYQCARRF